MTIASATRIVRIHRCQPSSLRERRYRVPAAPDSVSASSLWTAL
jgi:hypothetical protein